MPCFQAHQPAPPSSSPPDGESPFCNMPHFRAHQPVPPSSSPPESESSFPTFHLSELTNSLLLFLPSMNRVFHFQCAHFSSSTTRSSLFLPSITVFLYL